MRNPVLAQVFSTFGRMFATGNEEAATEVSETLNSQQGYNKQPNEIEHFVDLNGDERLDKKRRRGREMDAIEETKKRQSDDDKNKEIYKQLRKDLANDNTDENTMYDRRSKQIFIASNSQQTKESSRKLRKEYSTSRTSKPVLPERRMPRKTSRTEYSRSRKVQPVRTDSSQNSASSVDNRTCKLKLRRQDRKSLDVIHDCIVYNQYDRPERIENSPAVNEFLNSITNDIVENKEPIPKDPLTRPALGAAGMFPTKKWLANLRRKGIQPEPNIHYKNTKRGNFRSNTSPRKKHYKVMRADSSRSSRHGNSSFRRRPSTRARSERLENLKRKATDFTRSLKRDTYRPRKRLDGRTRTSAAMTVMFRRLSRALNYRRRSPTISEASE